MMSAKLNRAQLLEEIEIEEELERRRLSKRENYVPNEGQVKVHASQKTVRAVFAGNGGGKTALGVNEALWAASGYNPITKKTTKVPARVIVVLDKPDKVDKVWLPEIKKWYPLKPEQLHKNGKPYYSEIRFPNGSEIFFMFHDQEPMSFESIELDMAIFDEPPPRPVYIALRRGGRKKGTKPRYLIIGTPISAAWMRKEIYEPWSRGEAPDTECFRYGTQVNKQNLADGYIESFSSVLSEKERRIRLEGEFFDLEGLALAHLFRRDTHVIPYPKWPTNWPCVVVIDPAQSKAHVAILVGIKPNEDLVVLKEISSKKSPSEFARELRNFYQGFRVVDIVCDSMGSAGAYNDDSFIQVLNKAGVRARATAYKEKQDEAWISNIQEALAMPLEADPHGKKEPRLKVVEDCIGTIADIETVEWQKYRNIDEFKPKLAIEKKDFLACVKYALATRPRFNKSRERAIAYRNNSAWKGLRQK